MTNGKGGLSPEEKLLRAIFGEKACDEGDFPLKHLPGVSLQACERYALDYLATMMGTTSEEIVSIAVRRMLYDPAPDVFCQWARGYLSSPNAEVVYGALKDIYSIRHSRSAVQEEEA